MNNPLNTLKDDVSAFVFGMSRSRALEKGVCVNCKKPPEFYTEAGKREYDISALCEKCWGSIVGGD